MYVFVVCFGASQLLTDNAFHRGSKTKGLGTHRGHATSKNPWYACEKIYKIDLVMKSSICDMKRLTIPSPIKDSTMQAFIFHLNI